MANCIFCGKGAGHTTMDCPKKGELPGIGRQSGQADLRAQLKAKDKRIKALEEEVADLRSRNAGVTVGVTEPDSVTSAEHPPTTILGGAETHNCKNCGIAFLPKRSNARFCSTRCRVAFNRRKR